MDFVTGTALAIQPGHYADKSEAECRQIIDTADLVIMVATVGENAAAASVIAETCRLKGVAFVRFQIDGEFVSVPSDSGVVDRPVGAGDYVALRATA